MSPRTLEAGVLGAIARGHRAAAELRPGTCIAVVGAGDERTAWAVALERAGAVVTVADDVAALRAGAAWIDADLAIVGTSPAAPEELEEPDAPPFIAVRDALIASELATLLRGGARDVLVRPVAEADHVGACARALARARPRPARIPARAAAAHELPVTGAIGAAIARTRLPVLIVGETGSGKSRLARMLHGTLTPAAPFVEINAGTLPGALLVSELFGHERGAFTGAVGAKQGLVAAADGGTIFLDEIGELPPDAQAQLLSFLDTGTYRRLGGVAPMRSDARLFTATNRDLRAAVAQGKFREDLYYRLASIVVPLPPLREQRARIPGLVGALLEQAAKRTGVPPPDLGADAMRVLAAHPWPGNVRQLRFVVERLAAVWAGQRIGAAEVSDVLEPAAPAPERGGCSLADMERELVERAMREARGNRTRAAEMLGITPRGLYNKLRRIGTSFRPPE